MKNIKFRAWDGFKFYEHEEIDYDVFTQNPKYWKMIFLPFSHHLDMHKKEIYEGHFLEFTQMDWRIGKEESFIAEVYYDYSNAALRIRTKNGLKGFFPVDKCRIVGNIFENPDFLK